MRETLARLVADRGHIEREIAIRDVRPRHYMLRMAAVAAGEKGDGPVLGIVASLSDVTRQHELQQTKNDVISLVSHEMRTPLTAIQGMTELLADYDVEPARRREMHLAINDEVKRLTRMITGVPRHHPPGIAAPPEMRLSPVQAPRRCWSASCCCWNRWPRSARSAWCAASPPDLPPLLADADLLSRAVENLVSNAIKYSPDGTEVTVRAERRRRQYIAIAVADHGYGIPEADLDRDFRKVLSRPARAGCGRARHRAGPGAGSRNCGAARRLRHRHAAKWTQGSTFTLRIPRRGPIVHWQFRLRACTERAHASPAAGVNMSNQPHILIADDERSIRLMLETGLTLNGFRVTSARTGREALEAASSGQFDAVLSDIYMPDGGGLELVDSLRAVDPNLPIVLMTAQGSLQVAVEAVARGASDFIGKPFEISAVVALLRRYLDARREAEAAAGPANADRKLSQAGLVGRSAPMVMVYKLIAQAARTDATVLIMGESGTGKELVARAIHDFSRASSRPFLRVNCSGLTDTLLEAELFGHTRGAFTGADRERAGLFEAADGGTLFLDELASTSPAFQASLLRVLQSGEVRRVGSTQSRRVNVRVIGASNAPLRDLVAAGSFRADLYYRLSVPQHRTAAAARSAPATWNCSPATSCSVPHRPTAAAAPHRRSRRRRWPRTISRAMSGNWKTPCAAPWRCRPAA